MVSPLTLSPLTLILTLLSPLTFLANLRPIFYKRYVDDIFIVFKSYCDVDAFYSYLNTRHENVKFACKKEKDNKLPF